MNADTSAKQQIVEKIKSSSNILVTVSTDPTVDELSAALALTMLLNKMKKHATAVVSGELPPAINFLEPDKMFENTVDSLRDFIIALDKEKADHLRYKVDGDVVKIFITPYRTTITEQDLDFSQGDYNVELVLALGVKNRDHLDKALVAHGRILHDATVVTLGKGEVSDLGSIDWQDANASSLSEMLISLTESLKADQPLLDEQVATALLTGIVAATDRFSNNLTSPRVMTMAAQLMAAGANQQLIAAKLEEAHEISTNSGKSDDSGDNNPPAEHSDGTTDLNEGESTKLNQGKSKRSRSKSRKNDGDLTISHEEEPAQVVDNEQQEASEDVEAALDEKIMASAPVQPSISVADLQADLANASAQIEETVSELPQPTPPVVAQSDMPGVDYVELPAPQPSAVSPDAAPQTTDTDSAEPTFGGTLNATAEEAAEQKRREEQADRNRTILTHDSHRYIADEPTTQAPLNGATATPEQPLIDIFAAPATPADLPGGFIDDKQATVNEPTVAPLNEMPYQPQTLAELDSLNRAPAENTNDARAAIDDVFNSQPPAQPIGPVEFTPGQPPLPPLPDFSTLPPLPPAPGFDQPAPFQPETSPQDIGDIFGAQQQSSPAAQPPVSVPNDPGQFKIPGQ